MLCGVRRFVGLGMSDDENKMRLLLIKVMDGIAAVMNSCKKAEMIIVISRSDGPRKSIKITVEPVADDVDTSGFVNLMPEPFNPERN